MKILLVFALLAAALLVDSGFDKYKSHSITATNDIYQTNYQNET